MVLSLLSPLPPSMYCKVYSQLYFFYYTCSSLVENLSEAQITRRSPCNYLLLLCSVYIIQIKFKKIYKIQKLHQKTQKRKESVPGSVISQVTWNGWRTSRKPWWPGRGPSSTTRVVSSRTPIRPMVQSGRWSSPRPCTGRSLRWDVCSFLPWRSTRNGYVLFISNSSRRRIFRGMPGCSPVV